jgi:hypothetical protein
MILHLCGLEVKPGVDGAAARLGVIEPPRAVDTPIGSYKNGETVSSSAVILMACVAFLFNRHQNIQPVFTRLGTDSTCYWRAHRSVEQKRIPEADFL